MFLWWVVSTSPNSQAVGPPLVGYPRVLIQYIRSQLPYWRPFLYPQPEDVACHVDRDPLITECLILPRAERNYSMNFQWWHHLPAWQFLSPSGPHNSAPAEFIYLFIMCSVDPYKVDIELVKVNVTYSYKWEIKL